MAEHNNHHHHVHLAQDLESTLVPFISDVSRSHYDKDDLRRKADGTKKHAGICADHDHEENNTLGKNTEMSFHHHDEHIIFDMHVHDHGAGCDHGESRFIPEILGDHHGHSHGSSCDHDGQTLSLEQTVFNSGILFQGMHHDEEHGHCKECGEHIKKTEKLCSKCK